MKKSHAGFTALELLIVIGIIGVIVAIALVGLTRARAKSRDDSRIANMRIVQIALEDYKTACRNYPYALDTTADNCAFAGGTTTFGEFLFSLPENPLGTSFQYYAYAYQNDPETCIGYHLGVPLEMDNHNALATDSDIDSSNTALGTVSCEPGNTTPFNGAMDDANNMYDVYR